MMQDRAGLAPELSKPLSGVTQLARTAATNPHGPQPSPGSCHAPSTPHEWSCEELRSLNEHRGTNHDKKAPKGAISSWRHGETFQRLKLELDRNILTLLLKTRREILAKREVWASICSTFPRFSTLCRETRYTSHGNTSPPD